jgi:aspartyl-tRNA(Asn)/glutamyl-tRNA(Gln) amidotransferase subunit A
VVGVKPSYGRVSRYGLIAFASSLDQVGPFAQDVRSAARVHGVIAGHDPSDSTSADVAVPDYERACEQSIVGLRVGIAKQYFGEGLDPEVKKGVERALDTLDALGCELKTVDKPHTKYGVSTYYRLATAEASSNLARFDGVRFGLREEPPRGDIHQMYRATRARGFGTEVKRRIMLGSYALSAGYYDAYYAKAQRVRTLIRQDFAKAFERVDVLVSPISPTPAFRLGEKLSDPLSMYLSDVFTLPASLAGVCGVSVPAGLTAATAERPSLPIGVQIVAPAFAEERLFSVAAAWEARSPVKGSRPPPVT